MNIRNLAFMAFIGIIVCGIAFFGFYEVRNKPVTAPKGHQHQLQGPNKDRSASISKGTALILLAVGVIGALSVRRKKKNKSGPAQKNETKKASDDRNKEFVRLNKQYLNMQYKLTQHEFSGETPPDFLLKEISDLERKVRLISRAFE
ncbi:MAG: hypothetical protein PVI71_04240 [Desulfobacterales bacterium]